MLKPLLPGSSTPDEAAGADGPIVLVAAAAAAAGLLLLLLLLLPLPLLLPAGPEPVPTGEMICVRGRRDTEGRNGRWIALLLNPEEDCHGRARSSGLQKMGWGRGVRECFAHHLQPHTRPKHPAESIIVSSIFKPALHQGPIRTLR